MLGLPSVTAGDVLGSYIAIVGSITAGTFPLQFLIEGQLVGQSQLVTLQPEAPDLTRLVLLFLGLPSPSASVAAGSNVTATLMWTDGFGNTQDLNQFLKVEFG